MLGLLSSLVLVMSAFKPSEGYSYGAPSGACYTMTPGHDQPPRNTSEAPYQVQVDTTGLTAGQQLTVNLSSPTGEYFMGFLLQARLSVDEGSNVGTFEIQSEEDYEFMRYLRCYRKSQTGLTHARPAPKDEISVAWRAPEDFSGEVKIFATVVQDFDNYWVNLESETIYVTP